MNYTSIEQSTYLLSLGLDENTADMWYDFANHIRVDYKDKNYNWSWIPCWSLGALLELIPHTGFDGIELNNYNDGKTIWTAIFHWKTDSTPIRIADTPLDAVYEVVVWLLENGFIKKKSKTFSK